MTIASSDRVQGLHECVTTCQHRPLIDVAFVRDLARIDGGRFGEQSAHAACAEERVAGLHIPKARLDKAAYRGMGENRFGRCIG